jgi:simple sugar transport system substrate-binding protein
MALLVLGVAGATTAQGGQTTPTPPRIAFIVQRTDGSADWPAIRNGARDAAALLGVDLAYRTVSNWPAVASAVDQMLASEPDAVAIASADRARLDDEVDRIGSAGIPLIAVRWIGDPWQPDEVLARVGMDPDVAGRAAGEQLVARGATHAICVKGFLQVADLDVRCRAAGEVLAQAGGRMDDLIALDPPGDPSGIQGAIAARLRQDPSIDGVLLSGTERVEQAARAIAAADDAHRIAAGVVGTDPQTQAAIDAGELDFAVASQPYLEGYLPVSFLSLFLDRGLVAGAGEPVMTGPVVIEAAAQPSV